MKKFNQFLKESSVTPEDVARKIVSILDNNFPNRIRVKHDSNLLSLSFDVIGPVTRGEIAKPGDYGTKNRSLAKKLASQIVSSLKTIIKLEDSSIESDDRDAYVNLFMVSDSFIGMPDLKRPRGVAIVNEQTDGWTKDAELLKLTRKAMSAIAGSKKQKDLIKQLNVLRKKHGLSPLKESDELDERCWTGYKPTPGKKPYEKGSCMKEDDIQEEAEHDGEKVTLNKPFRTPDGPKKFAVYVKNDKGNVVKVTFGDPDMEIKRDSDDRKANFRARHNCDDPGPKWKARYWSCKMWSDKPVSKIAESEYIDTIQKIRESAVNEGYDFQELSGPKKKDVVGGIVNAPGNSPEDAIEKRMIAFGYRNISITLKDGVYTVKAQWGANPKDSYSGYYKLKESAEADLSSAAKLFQKFLRSTGAPDKVTTFVPKENPSKKIFVGKSSDSKFDYAVDVSGGVVVATERGTVRNRSFRWNEKSGKLEINEEAPPDAKIKKWINENRQEFSKQYGLQKGRQVLYATAWRMYTNK